tara:strand:- start:69 stop:494 length:426 start_codon:yes stop_codon:yes gene_type:complete
MTFRYSKRLRNEPPEYGIFSKRCLICLETKHSDFYKENPNCNHNICIVCLDNWIKINDKCPLCKKNILYSEPIYDDYEIYTPIHNVLNPLRHVTTVFSYFFNYLHQYIWDNEYNPHIVDDYEDTYDRILNYIHSEYGWLNT